MAKEKILETGFMYWITLQQQMKFFTMEKKGKPIIIADDGSIRHQFLHADDAALAFGGIIGKKHCIDLRFAQYIA